MNFSHTLFHNHKLICEQLIKQTELIKLNCAEYSIRQWAGEMYDLVNKGLTSTQLTGRTSRMLQSGADNKMHSTLLLGA